MATLCAAVAITAVPPALADGAKQVRPPGAQYNFGDSFQDASYDCHWFTTIFPSSLGACSNYRNTPMQLGAISPYSFSMANDFAAGSTASGAGTYTWTSSINVPAYPSTAYPDYPNLFGQIAYFKSLNRIITATDLVSISYGNNDPAIYTPASGATLAATVAGNLKTAVSDLIALGGRNFILFGNVRMTDPTYQAALASDLPATLAPLSSRNVHIRILDAAEIDRRIQSNTNPYGIGAGDCFTASGCAAAPLAIQNQYAYAEEHPSDSLSLLYAKYINSLIGAADGIAAQPEIAAVQITSFSDAIVGRLDLAHAGNYTRTVSTGSVHVFAMANYGSGRRATEANATGYRYSSGGATMGVEYLANANALFGLAFDYGHPVARLNDASGAIGVNSYLISGYASFSHPNWFADAIAAGGIAHYAVSRPGVIDTLTASPDGTSATARGRAGYFFGSRKIQFGPVIDANFVSEHVGSYGEKGDSILTQSVSGQNFKTFTAGAMLQIRKGAVQSQRPRPGDSGSWFLNIGIEHQFLGDERLIMATPTDPISAIPLYSPVAGQTATYGKTSFGVSGRVMGPVYLSAQINQTLARSRGNDLSANVGMTIVLN